MMIQLVHYTSLSDQPPTMGSENDGDALPQPPKPHMDMMGTKLAFWVVDSVNMTEYADKLEEESHRQGFAKVRILNKLFLKTRLRFEKSLFGKLDLN